MAQRDSSEAPEPSGGLRNWRCGTARADLTPAEDQLHGAIRTIGFWYERALPMTAVRHPIAARVATLTDSVTRTALVSWDGLGDAIGLADRVRDRLCAAGLTSVRLFMAATHAHTTPDTLDLCGMALPGDYLANVAERIAAAVEIAIRSEQPAAALVVNDGPGPPLSLNRRPLLRDGTLAVLESEIDADAIADPGALDNRLTVLRVLGEDGAALLRIVHWACHGVCMQAVPEISPGFPGRAMDRLSRADGIASLYFNGAAGDINPREMGSWEDDDRLTEALVAAVTRLESSLSLPISHPLTADTVLRVAESRVAARRRAAADGDGRSFAAVDGDARYTSPGWTAYLRTQAERVAALPEQLDLPLCVVRAGDVALAGAGGEIFAEQGLRLRAARPGVRVLPVSYVNGYRGYLAPETAYALGGYETSCAPWCPLAPGETERVMRALAALVAD